MRSVLLVGLMLVAGGAHAQLAPWWTSAGGGTRCVESRMSPADRIEQIRGNRLVPEVREYGPRGAPFMVQVSGGEWTWTYYRSEGICEIELQGQRPAAHLR